jgi:hypothetical protein
MIPETWRSRAGRPSLVGSVRRFRRSAAVGALDEVRQRARDHRRISRRGKNGTASAACGPRRKVIAHRALRFEDEGGSLCGALDASADHSRAVSESPLLSVRKEERMGGSDLRSGNPTAGKSERGGHRAITSTSQADFDSESAGTLEDPGLFIASVSRNCS